MNKTDKGIWATMILNGIIWISGGVVAAAAINKTGDGRWGWLMLIPALSGYSYKSGHSNNE